MLVIIDLWTNYGNDVTNQRPKTDIFFNSKLPKLLQLPLLFSFFPTKGVMACPTKFNNNKLDVSKQQDRFKPLVLYACEPSIHGRFVREALSSLQIHYNYISTAKNSLLKNKDSDLFLEATRTFQFDPKKHFLLIDPNVTKAAANNNSKKKNDSETAVKDVRIENVTYFCKDDSKHAVEYLFRTYQGGDIIPMTNKIENNLGRNGSFIDQVIKNIM